MTATAARAPFLRLLRDVAVLSGGELGAKIAGFLAFALLARRLDLAGYGAVELAAALAMVFGLVIDFGLGPIGARAVARRPESAPGLASAIVARRALLGVLAVALMLATIQVLDLSPAGRKVAMLFALSLLALPLQLNWLLQGLDRMAAVAPASMLRMGVFLLGVLLLVDGPADLGVVGGVEIAAMTTMALYYVAAAWKPLAGARQATATEEGHHLLRQAAPVAASQLVWALNHYLPILFVATFAGEKTLALFGGAHRVVISLHAFVWLYYFALYPSLARATARPESDEPDDDIAGVTRLSWRLTIVVGLAGGLTATLLAAPICRLAFGDDFGGAAPTFAILAWILPLHLLSGHARYTLIATGHQRAEMAAQAVGLVATIGLGLWWVGPWGGPGVAAAMVASAAIVWAVAHVQARRRVGALSPLVAGDRP